MCNQGNGYSHDHHHYPEIVQLMPVQKKLYAVYNTKESYDFAVQKGKGNISIVPILFMGLIKHGEKTMVEGFFASASILSCEDLEGFKGYAASLEDAEKLYS